MANLSKLISVFEETRRGLDQPGNCFDWSSWTDSEAALKEIDEVLAELRTGTLPDNFRLQVLFAATGNIQEVSLSSGWGHYFLDLSARFDAAMASFL